MDTSKILSLVEQLDDDIDDLEEALAPLLEKSLAATASKVPLLDKAKLYVLVTYAIESILFSYLRINGVKAREHPVFTELTRVKQYFDKIKAAETPAAPRTNALDKAVAGRFIKAGLSGNEKRDLLRAEEKAKERARAHIKFDELSKQIEKRKAEAVEQSSNDAVSDSSSSASSSSGASAESPKQPQSAGIIQNKRQKPNQSANQSSEDNSISSSANPTADSAKKNNKDNRVIGNSKTWKRPTQKAREQRRKARGNEAAVANPLARGES